MSGVDGIKGFLGADFTGERITLRAPAPVDFVDAYVAGLKSGDGAMRLAGLRIEAGEVMTFLGSRASGAHTALSALCGLAPIEQGRILVGGRDVAKTDAPAFRAEIAYASADLVFPPMSALALVRRLAPFADEETARGAFARCLPAAFGVGADDLVTAAAPAATRLRLALAGALARRAPLIAIALDDADICPNLLELLTDQTRALRQRTTIILAGRDPALLTLADRAAVFDRGRINAFGPAAQVLAEPAGPARRFAFARLA
jgi:ABC-type branched-subunit amino acid transport system ATPase component